MIKLSPSEKKHVIIKETLCKKRSRKLCIVSHYDPNSMIQDYVSYMLKELYRAGFDIVLVSTSQFVPKTQRAKIDKYLRAFILKKNSGYDFLSWKIGMGMCKEFSSYNELLLINDSMFFPLTRPKKIFDLMKSRKYDFWGLLDSYSRRYHVQSFFWFFNKKIKNSIFFSSFWQQCEVLNDKTKIINQYETQFTTLAKDNGFRVGSYIETEKVREDLSSFGLHVPKDEILFYTLWQVVIGRFAAPLLKRNMLCPRHQDFNPLTKNWKKIVGNHTDYNLQLISKYLSGCEEPDSHNKYNWIIHFRDFVTHILSLKKANIKVVLYGYGYVGKLVHSILGDNAVALFDRNCEYLNTVNSIEVFPIDKIMDVKFDKVFICSFGREEEVGAHLRVCGVSESKIITLANFLEVDALGFSNFLTKLLKTFHGLSYFRMIDMKFQFYRTDMGVVQIINDYLKFVNIAPLEVYETQNNKSLDEIALVAPVRSEVLDVWKIF